MIKKLNKKNKKKKHARNIYDKASKILNIDMKELCFETSEGELSKTENTQIAIAVTSLAVLEVLKKYNIEAKVCTGLSLGEYVALMYAGILEIEDGLKFLKQRGYYMGNYIPNEEYAMAAVIGLDSEKIEEECKKIAKEIGYPVILKASAGGGGKGIRIAYSEEELIKEYNIVRNEAKVSFNDDSLYIEKFIENPRHIEIQIMADEHGNVIHLGERDCTIQRNNQKILEETPSSFIDEKLRKKMGEVSVKALEKIGYSNLGTIEFLVDKNKNFYFMEMNTRVQVEHPITEMLTGIDIIKEQLKIASKEELSYKQKRY